MEQEAMMAIPASIHADSLADVLERVLNTGIVIVGDIKLDLCDVELLSLRIRLFIASVETAKKHGMNWWEDEGFSKNAFALKRENDLLKERIETLEKKSTKNRNNK